MSTDRPRRWITVVLSLLMAGLGHVYAGRVGRAIAIFALVEVLLVGSNVLFAAGPVSIPVIAVWGIAGLAVAVAIPVDAALCARLPRTRLATRGAVVGACVADLVGSTTIGLVLEIARERTLGQSVYVPSGGMFATLQIGDHFFTNPLAYRFREPQLGDIVVVRIARDGSQSVPADLQPDLPQEMFVKRIVGLPGDSVVLSGHVLFVNGERRTATSNGGSVVDSTGVNRDRVTEELGGRRYEVLDDPRREPVSLGPTLVEPGRVYVAGDNRDNSNDSRYFGTISQSDVLGPISRIYWSWDFRGTSAELFDPRVWYQLLTTKTRWDRIGVRPE